MFRYVFLILFLPIRVLFYFYLRLSLFLQRKRTVFRLELPVSFEDSHKSFFVKKFQGKSESVTRLEFLQTLDLIQKTNQIKTVKILIPPLEWTLSEFEEVRQELIKIQLSGKEVQMYAKEGGTGTLLLLSASDKSFLGVESEFSVSLPSAEPLFYGDFLKFWGVSVEAYASGPYKSFAESFTRGSFTPEAKKNLSELILELQTYILNLFTKKGKIPKELFYRPNLTADQLKSSGFINDIIDLDTFFPEKEKYISESVPRILELVSNFKLFPKSKFEIVVLPLVGAIGGGSYDNKQRENGKIEAFSVIPTLQSLGEDKKVKGVILEISSPGGSAFYSEQIFQAIQKLKEKKTVTCYFKDTVASGGYYIGSAASFITASPVTITGSIGAVMIRANLQKLYKKFKLNKEAVGFYPLREIQSEFTPLKKESIQYLQKEIKRVEALFYRRVSEGRKIPMEVLPKIGMGRVYLPKLEPKIVDQIGGLLDAIREMKESLKNIPLVVVSDLPTYNFKNKIPLIGGIIQKLQFLSSIDEISYLSTFEIKFTNKR